MELDVQRRNCDLYRRKKYLTGKLSSKLDPTGRNRSQKVETDR